MNPWGTRPQPIVYRPFILVWFLDSSSTRDSDMYEEALFTWVPSGDMERGSFTADFDREDNSFTRDSGRYVREGSGNGHLSP